MRILSAVPLVLAMAGVVAAQDTLQVTLEPAFPDLVFLGPTDMQHDGNGRLYVAERTGRILTFPHDSSATEARTFLDIEDRVNDDAAELGLLGMAFDPEYGENGFVYVDYTTASPLRTRISRFTRSAADSTLADPASEVILLEVDQPFEGHNAGAIAFGPDGYLYVTLGDGGSGADPHDNGQNRLTLLGSIVRLDVRGEGLPLDCAGRGIADPPEEEFAATVPPDNPFVDSTGCDEIFAYGLRNPWRISFDTVTGNLWAGDVGQFAWEEIDLIEAGRNYGWDTMEGTHCFEPPTFCNRTGLTLPVWEYGHADGDCAVTGGFVYRGSAIPALYGRYVFGDFCSGRIWALAIDKDEVSATLLASTDLFALTTFGVDEGGELYTFGNNGRLRVLAAPLDDPDDPGDQPTGDDTEEDDPSLPPSIPRELTVTGPNPISQGTSLRFVADGRARLAVYDLLGREVVVLFDAVAEAGVPQIVPVGAGSLATGTYVAHLTDGSGRSEAVRLVVLR